MGAGLLCVLIAAAVILVSGVLGGSSGGSGASTAASTTLKGPRRAARAQAVRIRAAAIARPP